MNHRGSRKFKTADHYTAAVDGYHLLPFRFHQLDEAREVLVNEVGDFLVAPRGTAARVVARDIDRSEELFADLMAGFFISDSSVPPLIDVLAARYRTKKRFLERDSLLHIIVPTLRCNHTCHYCQVSRQSEDRFEFDMSTEDLEAALDLIFRSRAQHLTIEFQGGEPFLAFDLVRRGVDGAKRRNARGDRHVTFVVCTNLSVLDDEVLEYCRDEDILISTSLDGPPIIHDSNRRLSRGASYEAAIAGLRRVRDVLGEDRVSALMTTSRLSLSHPREIVDTYVQNDLDHIFLRDVSPFGFAVRGRTLNQYSVQEFLDFFKTALDYILELNRRGTRLVEVYSSIILKKILTPFNEGYVDLQSPAGLVNSVVVYNYDGGVYASDESRMLAEVGDHKFRLGSVHDSYEKLFFGEAVDEIAEAWSNEGLAGCSDCAFQAYCGADPVRNWATQHDLHGYRPHSDYCAKNMEIIRHLIDLMSGDKEIERIFRTWVN